MWGEQLWCTHLWHQKPLLQHHYRLSHKLLLRRQSLKVSAWGAWGCWQKLLSCSGRAVHSEAGWQGCWLERQAGFGWELRSELLMLLMKCSCSKVRVLQWPEKIQELPDVRFHKHTMIGWRVEACTTFTFSDHMWWFSSNEIVIVFDGVSTDLYLLDFWVLDTNARAKWNVRLIHIWRSGRVRHFCSL